MQAFWGGFEKRAMKEVATVGIIDIDGRKILMGKRRDNGKWTGPGGHLEGKEKPIDGAIRETWEEAGIRLGDDDLIHVKSKLIKKPAGEKLRVHAFKVFVGTDHLPRTTMRNDPDREVQRWQWVPMAGGLPEEVRNNLHVPLGRNVLLDNLDLKDEDAEYKTAFWKGFEKKAGFIPAALTHVMQNAGMKALSHSPAYGNQMARSLQQGFQGKAPGRFRQFFRGLTGGLGIPETTAMTNHAYDLGSGFAKTLRENGITHLNPREQLLLRHLSRGEFEKAMQRSTRAVPDAARRQQIMDAFGKHAPLPPGALQGAMQGSMQAAQSSGALKNLEAEWKNPKNALTSNILSRATNKLDKGPAHYPTQAIVPAAAQPLAHKTQLAGAAAGSALLGALDPITAGVNMGKMTLTNPAARAGLNKIPFASKLLHKADSTFIHQPVQEGVNASLQGQALSRPKQFLRTYGMNAASASAADTANSLGLAMRRAK